MSLAGAGALPEDARCAVHPGARAVAVCGRCGGFACQGCALAGEGWRRCSRCGPPAVSHRVPGQLTFALIAAAIGMMCAPLSLLGIALAAAWKWGRWEERTPLERDYVRWAIWAGLVGLAFSSSATFLAWSTMRG